MAEVRPTGLSTLAAVRNKEFLQYVSTKEVFTLTFTLVLDLFLGSLKSIYLEMLSENKNKDRIT